MRRILPFLLVAFTVAPMAWAQEDGAMADRMDRLERDINFLQRQVYRGASTDPNAGGGPIANGGQLEVRLSQMDEEIRQMRGMIEQVQFQNKQNADNLKKLSDDVDYRLRALEQQQQQAAAAQAPAPTPAPTPTEPPKPAQAATYQPDTAPALTGGDFPNANAHYSYAFKLLNDKKYAEAGASFDAFVKKYPKDPLTSNAYYWLGESYYARGDFTRSTESFRKGFEVNPDGQKAPDNLLKLAMSLGQVKRTNEACIVLSQIVSKYGQTAPRTVQRATEQRTALQCK